MTPPGQHPPSCEEASAADVPSLGEIEAVMAKYPQIAEVNHPAEVRFFELYEALWRPGTDLDAIATLAMIYPPRTQPLASEENH